MSRRRIVYAALVVASFVVSACTQPMAPARGDTIKCPDGTVIIAGSGVLCGDN
jgi:hypothetical protein